MTILDIVELIDTGRHFHERFVLKALVPLDHNEVLEAGRLLVGLNGMGGGVVHTEPPKPKGKK